MLIKEEKRNLFEVEDKYYLVHCISSDCQMGAGIAIEFNKKFKLRNKVKAIVDEWMIEKGVYPNCVLIDNVFNLITKKNYWNKPTYDSLKLSLQTMSMYCLSRSIKYLAMPKIGCGLDRLQWGRVREMIEEIFTDIDIEILVCHL